MKCVEALAAWQDIRKQFKPDCTLGFVPTMGALHQGHVSLLERARKENDIIILSIFVNPTQFNHAGDYQNYPQTLHEDKNVAEQVGVDYLLLPQTLEMYPEGYSFTMSANLEIGALFEGEARPGHFSGMLTIVMKLLQLTCPTRAYFGEKDYQQLLLVRQMVEYFFMGTQIIACPTVRECSGLPLSSRNQRLTPQQKQLAVQAYALIKQATPQTLDSIQQQLLALGVTVEYLKSYKGRVFLAIRIGAVRLIDNFIVEPELC